jgi:hypothetical protein
MNTTVYKVLYFTFRNVGWILLLGFLLMLFAYMSNVIYNQKIQLEYAQAVYHRQQNEMIGVKDELSQKLNQLGQQETKVVALAGDKQSLQMLLNAQDRFLSVKLKELELKLHDLKSVTNLKVTTSGQFVTVTRDSIIERVTEKLAGDTLRQEIIKEKLTLINYKEPQGWFTMTGSISGDTMKFEPIFFEEYDIAIHDERKPKRYLLDLFPGKHTVGTVISKNPYTRTNHVKVILQEKEKRKLFGIF